MAKSTYAPLSLQSTPELTKDFHQAARAVVEQLAEVHRENVRELQDEIRKLQAELQQENSGNFFSRSPLGRLPDLTSPRKPHGASYDVALDVHSRDWHWDGSDSPRDQIQILDLKHVRVAAKSESFTFESDASRQTSPQSSECLTTPKTIRFKDQASSDSFRSNGNGHKLNDTKESKLSRKSYASTGFTGVDSDHRFILSETASYRSHKSGKTSAISNESCFTLFGNNNKLDNKLERLGNKTLSGFNTVDAWKRLVVHTLEQCGQTDLRRLRAVWIQSEAFVNKIQRNHIDVDIHGAVPSRQQIAQATSMIGRVRRSIRGRHAILSIGAVQSRFTAVTAQDCTCVIDPHSPLRLFWALMGMSLMVYDLIVLPMEAFELPDYDFFRGMTLGSQIFWTVDILVTCVTAVYIDSKLETRLDRIGYKYAKTWLAFDVTVVSALWVVLFVVPTESRNEVKGSLTSIKYVRILRFLRIVRVAKFESLLVEVVAVFNSHDFLLLVGIVKLMVIMILVNHILACIFFAVGRAQEGGWANRESIDERGFWFRYFAAMHWALTQFQGTSDILPGSELGERAYAVGCVIFALLALSSFVSSLTNMMMQLQNLHSERTAQERAVVGFLNDHEVSSGLSIRIKKYVQWRQRLKQKSEHDQTIYNILPPEFLMDLQDEVRSPHLVKHEFFRSFREVYPRILRRLCHECMDPVSPAPSEYIFRKGDLCHSVYFVTGGHFVYTILMLRRQVSGTQAVGDFRRGKSNFTIASMSTARSKGRRSTYQRPKSRWNAAWHWRSKTAVMENTLEESVTQGECVSEAVLWTEWVHQGEFKVISDSSLLLLHAEAFIKVVTSHPPAHASCVFYARNFIGGLNRFGTHHSDLIDQRRLWGIDTSHQAARHRLASDDDDIFPRDANSLYHALDESVES